MLDGNSDKIITYQYALEDNKFSAWVIHFLQEYCKYLGT